MQPSTRQSLESAVARYFSIPDDEAAIVVADLEPVVCRGGDWLFRQGDAADCMYLLARGRLHVWVDHPGSGEARPRLVGEVGPGEMVGEVGMLTGGERSAGLRAARNSLLLRVSSATFDRLVQRHPGLMRRVAGGIAERLRDRTAGRGGPNRRFTTVALLPLDGGPTALDLAMKLRDDLAPHGPTLVLTSATLGDVGVALPSPGAAGDISAALVDRLAEIEGEHRFVLYVADPAERAWCDLAVRHADLVLLVADASGDPAVRPWERAMFDGSAGLVSRRALVLEHSGSPDRLHGTADWLHEREVDFHLHLRSGLPGDRARLARMIAGAAVGLVLGGGAARGFAHLGVYRALVEAGIPVDWVGGSSIGAIMGAAIAGASSPDAVIARARAAFVEGKPFGDFTFPVVSMLRGGRMERLIGEYLGGEIEDLPVPLFCVSSNLGQGRLQVHERGSLPKALCATAALPGVFPPAVVNRQLTVDGGILDNLPVDLMRERPLGHVIAVDVTSRRNYEVDYQAVPSPWTVLAGRMLPFMKRYRVPGTVSMLLMAMSVGTMESSREAGKRADLLIMPDLGGFGFTDVRPFDRIVEAGYHAALEAIAGKEFAAQRDGNRGHA